MENIQLGNHSSSFSWFCSMGEELSAESLVPCISHVLGVIEVEKWELAGFNPAVASNSYIFYIFVNKYLISKNRGHGFFEKKIDILKTGLFCPNWIHFLSKTLQKILPLNLCLKSPRLFWLFYGAESFFNFIDLLKKLIINVSD